MALLLVLTAAAATTARGALDVLHGFAALRGGERGVDGVVRQHFEHVDEASGHRVSLHYEAEHDERVLPLHEAPLGDALSAVRCSAADDSHVVLEFVSVEARRDAEASVVRGTMLVGGHEWACERDGERSTIMRRVLDVQPVADDEAGTRLVLATQDVGFADVFRNADVRFHASHFPARHFEQTARARPLHGFY